MYQMHPSENTVVYASPEEAALAMAALASSDLVRLSRIAQIRSSGLHSCEWSDLLQDAITRTLDGSRRWPLHVSLVVFLREVMRSIASETRRRQSHEGTVPAFDAHGCDGRGRDVWQDVSSEEPDPERRVLARDMLERIRALFTDDAAALAILAGLSDGASPEQIQASAAMTTRDYDSTRRRIRRTLARNFPEK